MHPQTRPDITPPARGQYKEQQLSEEASKLLLAFWREKTSKICESQFHRWVGWCRERDTDFFSCPITEVVNFLTNLFVAKLDLKFRTYSQEGITFVPIALAKQSRQQKPRSVFFFPRYTQEDLLCPVVTLREYETHTKPLRGEYTNLFVGITKPHKPVCSSTIARWPKTLLGVKQE